MANDDLVLSRAEQRDLLQLLSDLYWPARANGPVPMQVDYWDDLMQQFHRWHDRLSPTEEEIERQANEAFNLHTYGPDRSQWPVDEPPQQPTD